MFPLRRRRGGRTTAAAAALSVAVLAQTAVAPLPAFASAPDLPRAYQVTSVGEAADVDSGSRQLAVSADGGTAVHLVPRGEQPPELVATDLRTGAQEPVGLDLEGQPVPQVIATAVSADGRTVAFVASGADAAALHLPPSADPDTGWAIFVRDRLTDATIWVPTPDLGVPASLHRLNGIALSADGKRLATEISLPLPKYDKVTKPEGVLLATLSPDTAPSTRVIGPEDLVVQGSDPAAGQPEVHGFALSGDGGVLAVNASRDFAPVLLRFDAGTGGRLPGDRALSNAQQQGWLPNLDHSGHRTALTGEAAGVVVADLAAGPSADVTLEASAKVPYVSGDVAFGDDQPPGEAWLTDDGSRVVFQRAGALWSQPAQPGRVPVLASPGLDGRIADPVGSESPIYPDAAVVAGASADGGVLAFLSASTAFVAARTDEPQPSHLYRAVPADVAAPSWPDGAQLSGVPGTTSVTVSWPAAGGAVQTYEVSVNGTKAVTVDAPATQAVLTNLAPGTTVQLAVVAKDAGGRASAPLATGVVLLSDLPAGDAPLSAVAGPGAVVHLHWDAPSLAGLTGYRVVRDGQPIADVAAAVTGYDDAKVAADTTYTYAVFALRGTEEIRLTRNASAHTPVLSVSDAAWNWPRIAGSTYVAPSRAATFALVGAPGFTGSAELTVRTATEPAQRIAVALTEEQPGRYTGSWTVPTGILEITSAVLHLADGAATTVDRNTGGLPAPVGGLVRAHVNAPSGSPAGARLQVWSESTRTGTTRVLNDNGVVEVPAVPAGDHAVSTVRSDGRPGTPARTIAVQAGQSIDVDLPVSVPATVTVTAVRADGQPMPVGTRIVLSTPAGPQAALADGRGGVLFTGVDAGTDVTVTADLTDAAIAAQGLAGRPSEQVRLRAGDNQVRLAASALPTVRLSGTTRTADGKPVRAQVTIGQQIRGSGVALQTDSREDGTWSITVTGNTGAPTTVSATNFTGGKVDTQVSVGGEAPSPVDLVLPAVNGYVVVPKLITKMLDGEAVEQTLDRANAVHFSAQVSWGGQSASAADHVAISAATGATVRFCADGYEIGLPRACGEAVAGADSTIPLTVTLTEQARITGRILGLDGTPYTGRLRAYLDGPTGTSSRLLNGPDLSLSAPTSGPLLLRIRLEEGANRDALVMRTVQATAGRIIAIGDLRPTGTRVLAGSESGFIAVTDEVVPGELAQLRATIAYADRTDAGTARFTLPAGVQIPEDGVLRDGQKVPFTIENSDGAQVLVVPLPAADTRTIQLYARTPAEAGRTFTFTASVTGRAGTETVSSATVLAGVLTLASTGHTRDGKMPVSGQAPAGVPVKVFDGERELTTATAGPGGLWNATVDLGTTGDDVSHHPVRARTQLGSLALESRTVDVVVDPHAAVVESVTFSQIQGRTITFRPDEGVAHFPYAFQNHQKITVKIGFTGPVTNVRVQLGTVSGVMTPVTGEPNTWSAELAPELEDLGGLRVFFDPVIERPILPLPNFPDPAKALIDTTTITRQDPVIEGDVISQTFTASAPKLGSNARVTATLTVQKLSGYEASAADKELAGRAGVRAWEVVQDGPPVESVTRNGTWSTARRGVVDLGSLYTSAPASMKSLVPLGFWTGPARMGFAVAFDLVTNGDSFYGADTTDGKWTSIDTLMHMAYECRSGSQIPYYIDMANILGQQALTLDAWNGIAFVAGMALAPETFGIGTVALWGAFWPMGKIMEMKLNNDIESLRQQLITDPLCIKDPTDPDSTGLDPNKWGNDLAAFTWIYDPSGVVYEGTADRKVEGATTTLLEAPTPDGPWTVWRAEDFGQANPQVTDGAGHYGWDVPEGWWKVVYAKDDYVTGESQPLRVLPPHTDVNANLVRRDLAKVDGMVADATGLTITFSQPVRVTQALAGGLSVSTPDGVPVHGVWSAAGETLATTFRFTGEKHSGNVVVVVDQLVQDHAGRALAGEARQTLAVSWAGPDSAAPRVSVTGVNDGGAYRLGAVPAIGCSTVDDGSGVATPATLTVTGGKVGLFTAACAGAVDKAGNAAAPVSVRFSVTYVFTGFAPPVDNGGVVNSAKAGQAIPLKWRLTTATGAPVTDLTNATIVVSTLDDKTGMPVNEVEIYATAESGLQNLGNGYYQLNWKTPKSYVGTAKVLRLDLGEGAAASHTALFWFR